MAAQAAAASRLALPAEGRAGLRHKVLLDLTERMEDEMHEAAARAGGTVSLSSQVLLRALRSDLDLAAPGSPRDLDLGASEEPTFLDDDETFSRTVQRAVHLKRLILEDLQSSHTARCRPAADGLQTLPTPSLQTQTLQTPQTLQIPQSLQTPQTGIRPQQLDDPDPELREGEGEDADGSGAEPSTEAAYVPNPNPNPNPKPNPNPSPNPNPNTNPTPNPPPSPNPGGLRAYGDGAGAITSTQPRPRGGAPLTARGTRARGGAACRR